MSVARFIADQRTKYQVPLVSVCALLGVSLAWFYKWWGRAQGPAAASGLHTPRDRRRDTVDRAVAVAFTRPVGCTGHPGCCTTCAMTGGRCRRRQSRTRCAAKAWSRGGSAAVTG